VLKHRQMLKHHQVLKHRQMLKHHQVLKHRQVLKHHQMLNHGQVLIETLVLLPVITVCFLLSLLFFHVHAQSLWMDHQLYQSLICMAKQQPKKYCINKMQKNIKSFLWTGHLKSIRYHKKPNEWHGFFTWENQFWTLHFKKKINLKRKHLL